MTNKKLEGTLNWAMADEIRALKLWQNPNEWPQTIVMTVSNSRYMEFSKDRKKFMEFVNAHKLFSKPVIFAGPWVSLSSQNQKSEPRGWMLTAIHGKVSTVTVAALQELDTEDASSKWISRTHGDVLAKAA